MGAAAAGASQQGRYRGLIVGGRPARCGFGSSRWATGCRRGWTTPSPITRSACPASSRSSSSSSSPRPASGGEPSRSFSPTKRDASCASCAGARIVALDERGAAWTTRTLAERLDRWRDESADVAFVIGSADGLDPELKRKADTVLAVSAMTLPHGLVRVMLAEQLYRAVSLNAGHPYHRD